MARDYLKDVKTMEDLRQRRRIMHEEVEQAKIQMQEQFDGLFDRTRNNLKKAAITTSVTGLASFILGKLLGGGKRHLLSRLHSGNAPAPFAAASAPSSSSGKLLLWAPIIKNVIMVILKFWKRDRGAGTPD